MFYGVERAYPYLLNMNGHSVGESPNLTIAKMYTYVVIIMIIIVTGKMLNLINISCSSCDSSLEIVLFELREAANSRVVRGEGCVFA